MLSASDLKKLVGDRISDQLPYESYDPETQLFYNKGTTGFVLLANPIVGASLEDQGQAAQFFRQEECLPEGCSLQFLLFASPYIDQALDFWVQPRMGKPLEKLALRRAEFLRKKTFIDTGSGLIRDYKILISYVQPGLHISEQETKALKTARKELRGMLDLLGMKTRIATAVDLLSELSSIVNLGQQTNLQEVNWNEEESLSKQIFDLDTIIDVEETGLHFKKQDLLVKSYTPKLYPKFWALGHMDRLLGDLLEKRHNIPCPYLLHFGITVESNQLKTKTKAIAKRETLESAYKGKVGKWVHDLEDQVIEANEIVEQFQMGARAVTTGLSMTIFVQREEVSHIENNLKLIWSKAGWGFQSADCDHLGVFLSVLPMTWTLGEKKRLFKKERWGMGSALKAMSKAKRTVTKEAQNLLPIVGEWKGQNSPGMPLIGRRGQLFFFNPFGVAFLPNAKNSQTNHPYGGIIVGQTGAGKSMTMNVLMETTIGVGGRVFVLDYGRSFKKNCQIAGGEHIEFDINLDISLNPFSKIPLGDSPEIKKEQLEFLACIRPIIQVMAAPKNGTNDLQNGYLEQAIHFAWEAEKNQATIDTVVRFLKNHAKKEAQDLGESLTAFSSKGSYSHFFNRPATVNFKSNLVVIETDDLRNHPDLMAVVVQMLILQINTLMSQGDRVTPFLIMIDEAWKLLAGKDSGAFISDATRTARKYKGAIILASQHLTDFFKPECPAATEAFNCSAWKLIMYQEKDVISSFHSHDHLQFFVDTEYKEEFLKSVHSNPPHYSEIAIFGPNVNGVVGRLCLDPFSRLLYSTNPEEYQAIENLINNGATVMEAVEIVADMQERQKNAA
jgi:conjugal transfer ATP-binding protein TraC